MLKIDATGTPTLSLDTSIPWGHLATIGFGSQMPTTTLNSADPDRPGRCAGPHGNGRR